MREKIFYFLWKFCHSIAENFAKEQNRYIVSLPILFAIGIGVYFSLSFEPNWVATLVLFELFLLIFYLCRFYKNLHILFVAILIVFCGFIDAQIQTMYHAKNVESSIAKTTYLKGQISDLSLSNKGKTRLLLTNSADFDKDLRGNFRITSANQSQQFYIGECVEMAANLFASSRPAIKNGYPLERKYFFENLSAVGYATSEIFKISCSDMQKNNYLRQTINQTRQNIIAQISKTLPKETAGVAAAILVGEKTYIKNDITDNYRNSGLAHFLSVSGLHLGTIAVLAFFFIRLLASFSTYLSLHYDIKKIAAVFAIFFSFCYLLLSGMAIPAQRAFIMTSVVFCGIIFNRQAVSMRMVSIAALVVLVLQPQALVSVSFQMSFAAVTALVAFYERYAVSISAWQTNRGIVGQVFFYLLGIVICDFVASVATAVFSLYHFQRLALYTSLGNLLAGPLIGLYLMPVILLCLVSIPFGLAYYPLKLLDWGIEILNHITDYVSHLSNSVLYSGAINFCALMLIACGGLWICIWQRPWRRWGIIPILLGLSCVFFHELPDSVVAYNGEGIIIRDNQGQMVEFPIKKIDSWTRKVWKENLQMQELSKEQKRDFAQLLAAKKGKLQWVDLQCNNKFCTYKKSLKIFFDGKIKLDDIDIEPKNGAYIYLDKDHSYYEPLRKDTQRIWDKKFGNKDKK